MNRVKQDLQRGFTTNGKGLITQNGGVSGVSGGITGPEHGPVTTARLKAADVIKGKVTA